MDCSQIYIQPHNHPMTDPQQLNWSVNARNWSLTEELMNESLALMINMKSPKYLFFHPGDQDVYHDRGDCRRRQCYFWGWRVTVTTSNGAGHITFLISWSQWRRTDIVVCIPTMLSILDIRVRSRFSFTISRVFSDLWSTDISSSLAVLQTL